MPATISFDLSEATSDQRTYARSALERFGWERMDGSVFRYPRRDIDPASQDDWLNDIAPSLMFFRSYIKSNDIQLARFTIDVQSTSFFEQDDGAWLMDLGLDEPEVMAAFEPTNKRSSIAAIRKFLKACVSKAP